MHVDFSTHIRTWAEGVVYGRVASEHKRPESLDHNFEHWAKPPAEPTPLDQFLPVRWQRAGYVRPTRLSNLAFYDLCKEHEVKNEDELWAKASELSEAGDRGMVAGTFARLICVSIAKTPWTLQGDPGTVHNHPPESPCACQNTIISAWAIAGDCW